MKFLKFVYAFGFLAVGLCLFNLFVYIYFLLHPAIRNPSLEALAGNCIGVMIVFMILVGFTFPYILKQFNEKKSLRVLSYFFIIVLLASTVFINTTNYRVTQPYFLGIWSLLILYICFSVQAKPISRLLRISAIVQTILVIPRLGLEKYLHESFLIYYDSYYIVSCVFNILLIRIAIRWVREEKVMQESLKEIQSIA